MRSATGLALMLTLAAGGVRAQGGAGAGTCAGPSIVLSPPLDQRRSWTRAAGDTRRRIAELRDIDACTRLEIEAADDSVQVRARAADGRSVVRPVARPSELEATVVALLVLPPAERDEALAVPGAETAASEATTTPDAKPKPLVPPPPVKPRPRQLETRDEREHGAQLPAGGAAGNASAFELALGGAGRSTGYLFGPGLSAVADFNLGGWLLGAAAHGEEVSGPSSTSGHFSAEHSVSIGAIFGRRLVRRPFFLDVALEAPVLALRTSRWTSRTVVSVPGESEDVGSTETDDALASRNVTSTQATTPNLDLRAGGLVRAVVPFVGNFGATLALDGERSLGLLHDQSAAGAPAALVYDFGLSLGLFWSGG